MNLRASLVIRYSIGLLFLWFGSQQLLHVVNWIAYLPEWTGYFPIPAEMLIKWNGWFEIIFALCLIAGFYTRLVAALLGIHLMGIALSVGGPTGVRDAILAATTIAIALTPADPYTLDQHLSVQTVKKKTT